MRFDIGNDRTLTLASGAGATTIQPTIGTGPRGLDGSNVLPTAAAVKQSILTDADVQAALSASFAGKANLIDSVKAPVFIAHRGGGSWVWPQHSLEGHMAAFDSGFSPEADLQRTSDGVEVVFHDETVDTNTYGTGSLASKTLAQFLALGVRPVVSGGTPGKTISWGTYLDRFGGRTVLFPEVKIYTSTGGISGGVARAPGLVQTVRDRGLERSVVFTAFDADIIQAVVAAGGVGMWTQPAGLNSSQIAAYASAMNSGGANLICVNQTCTQATINAMIAAGLRVYVYGLTTQAEVAQRLGWGAEGFYLDDPAWQAALVQRTRLRDSIGERRPWPNMGLKSSAIQSNTAFYETASGPALQIKGTGAPTVVHHGNLSKITRNGGTIEFTVRHLGGTGNNSVRVELAVADEAFQEGASAPSYYQVLLRRNGVVNAYSVAGSTSTQISATSGSDPIGPVLSDGAEGTDTRWRIAFTSTTITVTCLTNGNVRVYTNNVLAGPFSISVGGNHDASTSGALHSALVVTPGT